MQAVSDCFGADENYPSYILSLHNELQHVVNRITTHVNWKEAIQHPEGGMAPKTYKKILPADLEVKSACWACACTNLPG